MKIEKEKRIILDEKLKKFQEEMGIKFKDLSLLMVAFTHSSFAKRNKGEKIEDNERLEFLGDAVIKHVVSEYLYVKFPKLNEGDLTKIRSRMISDKNLAELAQKMNLGEYIRFSYGEKVSGGKKLVSNLANTFEALIGAYYLDAGGKKTSKFILDIIEKYSGSISEKDDVYDDYKTALQEIVQEKKYGLPVYEVIREVGPDHKKVFHIEVTVDSKPKAVVAKGKGYSKKDAEQAAAEEAYKKLKNI
jgi:ribonuclease III